MNPYKIRQERNDEMKTQTTIAQDMDSWHEERKLDEACCRLLANKVILARLLQAVVQEYQDCSVTELEHNYLKGEPSILSSAVDQDMPDPGRITGETTVDKSLAEGTTTYDILFSVYSPKRQQQSQIIINVENQNKWNPGYPLLKRAAYYYARLLSRQKGTVFTGSDYGRLQKVYTIWICLEPPKTKQNTITVFSMTPEHLVGNAEYAKMNYDMATVIMVCLGEEERKEKDILRLLRILLSPEIQPVRKKQVLEQEYGIPMTVKMEEEAENMCDIGRGIALKYAEKGMAEGMAKGMAQGMAQGMEKGRNEGIRQERESNIIGMLKEKIPMETIARITKVSVEQIQELGKLNGLL